MSSRSVFILYLTVMSTVLFIMMWHDKRQARLHARRMPEARLFLFAFLGGAVGGTLGMYVFRHKTRHTVFSLGFPLISLLQIFAASRL